MEYLLFAIPIAVLGVWGAWRLFLRRSERQNRDAEANRGNPGEERKAAQRGNPGEEGGG